MILVDCISLLSKTPKSKVLLNDGVHLSRLGHDLIGKAIGQAIVEECCSNPKSTTAMLRGECRGERTQQEVPRQFQVPFPVEVPPDVPIAMLKGSSQRPPSICNEDISMPYRWHSLVKPCSAQIRSATGHQGV